MTGFSAAVRTTIRTCTVEGCEKPYLAKGHCSMHWARWKKYGSVELPERPRQETCTVQDCSTPVRSTFAEYCEKHYGRVRRGKPIDADPQKISGPCVIDGCTRPAEVSAPGRTLDSSDGICRMHMLRKRTRGDYGFEMRGEKHPLWTGDDATVGAVHQRVRSKRGSATSWSCLDCARPAQHWSYDHTDPDERFDPEKGPYSLDVDRYFPRCVRCHKRFDMDYLAAKRASA